MKISVVIPAYNEEKYISGTIDSIKKLTLIPDEILIIDGGSTDKTKAIAEKMGARVVTVPHRGIGFARQRGLEEARGDIVAFTDADTVVPPHWTTKIVETLSRDGVSGVYSGYFVPRGWLPYLIFINFIQPIYQVFFQWIGHPVCPGQNMAFWKQKALEAGGYPSDFKIIEDQEMGRRLRTVGTLVFRLDNFVISSSRRGYEGINFFTRMAKAQWDYYTTRRADTGFPDIR